MTHVFTDSSTFRGEVISGFADAYSRYVVQVPGASGFVRRGPRRQGKVGLVVGGGSGHYPSYAGIVGPGLAEACVLGDVFTSPSAEQVYRVARQADGGAGLVLAFGNYAGDRLNFAAAQSRLLEEGIDTRIVYVTDDIASAPAGEEDLRRGIAGTVVVYKIGGAAADAGWSLDEVERVMRRANAATYSFGVAFAGCTLPGADEPLFHVESGRMEFGLGIHGEPGVQSHDWMPADELAAMLVESVLAERPVGSDGRAAVILNGLGGTKYEELFVLYTHISPLLAAAGVDSVLPEVGELVTSLDMAGCSLSITWLDDELEQLWRAPVDTAAFRRTDRQPDIGSREWIDLPSTAPGLGVASDESKRAAVNVCVALRVLVAAALDGEREWGQLDAAAGDGDHGRGMLRGARAALAAGDEALAAGGGAGSVLGAAAAAFSDHAGGTSGILWGILLADAGSTFGDQVRVDPGLIVDAVLHANETLQRVCGASPGDKTMVDALDPFARTLAEAYRTSGDICDAWNQAALAAQHGAESTVDLVARRGRARPLGERSRGIADPGATSMAVILTSIGAVIQDSFPPNQGESS